MIKDIFKHNSSFSKLSSVKWYSTWLDHLKNNSYLPMKDVIIEPLGNTVCSELYFCAISTISHWRLLQDKPLTLFHLFLSLNIKCICRNRAWIVRVVVEIRVDHLKTHHRSMLNQRFFVGTATQLVILTPPPIPWIGQGGGTLLLVYSNGLCSGVAILIFKGRDHLHVSHTHDYHSFHRR